MKPRQRLGVALSRAHHAFMGFLDGQLRACGLADSLRPGMGHVLYELMTEDDLTLTELSARARLAQSTVTGIVAQMESAGLLERRPDERDGRASRVRLSRRARSLRPRLEELDRRCDRAYKTELSAAEISALTTLLERLWTALAGRTSGPRRRTASMVRYSGGRRSTR